MQEKTDTSIIAGLLGPFEKMTKTLYTQNKVMEKRVRKDSSIITRMKTMHMTSDEKDQESFFFYECARTYSEIWLTYTNTLPNVTRCRWS